MKSLIIFLYRFLMVSASLVMLSFAVINYHLDNLFIIWITIACIGIICFIFSFKRKKILILHFILFLIFIVYTIWFNH